MSDTLIIYKTEDGGVAILTPVTSCGLTVEQIAAKDVPTGRPYKIVDRTELPTDFSEQDRWTVDEAHLTDGVGADYGVGSKKPFVMPEPPEDEAVEEDPVPPEEEPVT